jgi:phosphosulfolactate phosphohydrolase-like enzyme
MATLIKRYGMFTTNGNKMVGRIAEAGKKLAAEDGATSAWAFAYRELQKLSYAKDFEECTDTDVREQVFSYVVGDEDVPFYN